MNDLFINKRQILILGRNMEKVDVNEQIVKKTKIYRLDSTRNRSSLVFVVYHLVDWPFYLHHVEKKNNGSYNFSTNVKEEERFSHFVEFSQKRVSSCPMRSIRLMWGVKHEVISLFYLILFFWYYPYSSNCHG